MKKYPLQLIIGTLAVLAVAGYLIWQNTSGSKIGMPIPPPPPITTNPNPLPSFPSPGVLKPTNNGQTYTNIHLGVEFVVPAGWTLGTTSNANIVTFLDISAAKKYYNENQFQNMTEEQFTASAVLTLRYFDNFEQFSKSPYGLSGCTSLKQCSDNSTLPYFMQKFGKIGNEIIYKSAECGEICAQEYLIQHGDKIYDFASASYFYTNNGEIEKSLKFLAK